MAVGGVRCRRTLPFDGWSVREWLLGRGRVGRTEWLVECVDFSRLTDAMASRSFDKIVDICDQLMLQLASQAVAFQEEWSYVVHLLGHISLNDLNSARFLWKSIPSSIKKKCPESGKLGSTRELKIMQVFMIRFVDSIGVQRFKFSLPHLRVSDCAFILLFSRYCHDLRNSYQLSGKLEVGLVGKILGRSG